MKTRPVRIVREEIKNTQLYSSQKQNELAELEGELKAARSVLEKIEAQYNNLAAAKARADKKLILLHDEKKVLENRRNRTPLVSDHAVVRYIERVMGGDIEAVRKRISGSYSNKIKKMDDGRIERNDCTLVVTDNQVVTILAPGEES